MWSSSNNRKIQRVAGVLVMEDEKKKENDYYPKVVSIGPYHHGKPELAQVEAFKPMAVELLVRNPEEKESFYQQVMGMIREVRNCYEEESVAIYSDAYLARMMLQDASLIIIHMALCVNLVETIMDAVEPHRVWNAMIEHLGRLTIATLFHDFFLVENQVPLCVMELLIRLRYVDLMQSLVERPQDVKELRERRILYHQRGSDEEVLNVYKSINTHGASDYFLFLQVKNRIQAHYNSSTKTWMAELINTYFRSPWTVIAFLAATAVIALTAAQLHYALPTSN